MRRPISILTAALALSVAMVVAAGAETPVGKNVDSRVILAFKANDAAVQSQMPDGWTSLTLPQGPIAGSNLLLVFIDRHLQLDAEGKPADPHASRSVAVVAYGVQPGVEGARTFVTRVFETPPVADSYGNGTAARIARSHTLGDAGDGARRHTERWSLAPDSGGTLEISLDYSAGRPGWSSSELLPYSAADPDFHRIYRYDQLLELAMSDALGKPLAGEIAYETDIAELAAMLDGSETLTGVMVVPVYVREVSLP